MKIAQWLAAKLRKWGLIKEYVRSEDRKEDDVALDSIRGAVEQQTWDAAYMRRKVRAGERNE